jgi:TPP-dependent pyruvate/acetoin dehydrogenase alpha subunit
MDVEAVYRTAGELYEHGRAGNGPAFLIANCYRYYGHGRKDPSPYRDKAEEAEWRKKDPVEAQKARLIADGLLDEGVGRAGAVGGLEELGEAGTGGAALGVDLLGGGGGVLG